MTLRNIPLTTPNGKRRLCSRISRQLLPAPGPARVARFVRSPAFVPNRHTQSSHNATLPRRHAMESGVLVYSCSAGMRPSAHPGGTRVHPFHRGIPMSVSGIFSSGFSTNQVSSQHQLTNSQFQQLGQDLASGNLSAAQSDFAALAQALKQPATVSASSASNPVAQAFQQLASDLNSGNLAAAKQDYSTVSNLAHLSTNWRLHHHRGIGIRLDPNGNTGGDVNQSGSAAAQQGDAALQQLASGDGAQSGGPTTKGRYHPMPPIEKRISFVA